LYFVYTSFHKYIYIYVFGSALFFSRAAALEAGLATAPVRRVCVTGANSGVGLNGASRLLAAGHHVTLLCRTQAKADGAAAACQQFADAQQAAGSAAFRDGGSVVSATTKSVEGA
jgi:NAD(P)H-hydrate repair Nnr-like enzyme with NAD(P)H-hydrate epimerase domain